MQFFTLCCISMYSWLYCKRGFNFTILSRTYNDWLIYWWIKNAGLVFSNAAVWCKTHPGGVFPPWASCSRRRRRATPSSSSPAAASSRWCWTRVCQEQNLEDRRKRRPSTRMETRRGAGEGIIWLRRESRKGFGEDRRLKKNEEQ